MVVRKKKCGHKFSLKASDQFFVEAEVGWFRLENAVGRVSWWWSLDLLLHLLRSGTNVLHIILGLGVFLSNTCHPAPFHSHVWFCSEIILRVHVYATRVTSSSLTFLEKLFLTVRKANVMWLGSAVTMATWSDGGWVLHRATTSSRADTHKLTLLWLVWIIHFNIYVFNSLDCRFSLVLWWYVFTLRRDRLTVVGESSFSTLSSLQTLSRRKGIITKGSRQLHSLANNSGEKSWCIVCAVTRQTSVWRLHRRGIVVNYLRLLWLKTFPDLLADSQ